MILDYGVFLSRQFKVISLTTTRVQSTKNGSLTITKIKLKNCFFHPPPMKPIKLISNPLKILRLKGDPKDQLKMYFNCKISTGDKFFDRTAFHKLSENITKEQRFYNNILTLNKKCYLSIMKRNPCFFTFLCSFFKVDPYEKFEIEDERFEFLKRGRFNGIMLKLHGVLCGEKKEKECYLDNFSQIYCKMIENIKNDIKEECGIRNNFYSEVEIYNEYVKNNYLDGEGFFTLYERGVRDYVKKKFGLSVIDFKKLCKN